MDTRDLIQEREDAKEYILAEFNDRFNDRFIYSEIEDFEELEAYLDDEASKGLTEEEREDFFEYMADEYNAIREIDELEEEIYSREFENGIHLIEEDVFEDYVEEFVKDCGYIPKDLPSWIEIDWETTADNMRNDYSEVEFRGETYLYID